MQYLWTTAGMASGPLVLWRHGKVAYGKLCEWKNAMTGTKELDLGKQEQFCWSHPEYRWLQTEAKVLVLD